MARGNSQFELPGQLLAGLFAEKTVGNGKILFSRAFFLLAEPLVCAFFHFPAFFICSFFRFFFGPFGLKLFCDV